MLFRVGVTEADYLRDRPARSGAHRRRRRAPSGHRADARRRHRRIRRPAASTRSSAPSIRPPAHSALEIDLSQPRAAPAARPVRPGADPARDEAGALLVPQRAVQELQNLYSVAVVDGGGKVAFRNVKVGPRVGRALGDRGGPQARRAGGRRRPSADSGRHDGRRRSRRRQRPTDSAARQPAGEAK